MRARAWRQAPTIGERFGELTVVSHFDKTEQGNRWLLQCDCGRFAIRSTGALNQAINNGSSPCCSECRSELWGGVRGAARVGRAEALRTLWQEHRTLYGCDYVRREVAAIKAELEQMGQWWPEEDPPSREDIQRGWSETRAGHPVNRQGEPGDGAVPDGPEPVDPWEATSKPFDSDGVSRVTVERAGGVTTFRRSA